MIGIQNNQSFLHSIPTTVYEPRKGVFEKTGEAFMSKASYNTGRGHVRHYFNDGTGRDTYVQRDHGGFTKFYDPI